MLLNSNIRTKNDFSAIVTVELRVFSTSSPVGQEEAYFLLGIDLITGDVNISTGLKQGTTKLPEVPGNSTEEIEIAAAYAALEFLRHIEEGDAE